jgi:hypothetical protein
MKKLLLLALLSISGCIYYTDTKDTIFDQTKASSLLKKYEWFKNAAAQLSAFDATIKVQEKKLNFLESDRANWNRDDRQNWHQATVELAGVKAGYNNLAAEYNAAMSKANYRFCNVGDLPAGATETMRREFASYKED